MAKRWCFIVSVLALVCGCEGKPSGGGSKGAAPAQTAAAAKGAKKAATGASGAPAPAAPGGPVAGCTSFADHTSVNDVHSIPWDESLAKSPLRCIKIKAGQDITWEGDFAKNPMIPAGGDTPTPIADVRENVSNPGLKGEERSMTTFKKPGTFGYASSKTPAMKGAIQVVP